MGDMGKIVLGIGALGFVYFLFGSGPPQPPPNGNGNGGNADMRITSFRIII